MKKVVLFFAFALLSAPAFVQAQMACNITVDEKMKFELNCPTLSTYEFTVDVSALPFKTDESLVTLVRSISSNLVNFQEGPADGQILVTLNQQYTPGGGWTAADWQHYFDENHTRYLDMYHAVNQ